MQLLITHMDINIMSLQHQQTIPTVTNITSQQLHRQDMITAVVTVTQKPAPMSTHMPTDTKKMLAMITIITLHLHLL